MFALGIRASELPLPVPSSKLIDQKLARVSLPGVRRERRKVYRKLPIVNIRNYAPICLDTNDPFTIDCGLKQRLMRDIPEAPNLKQFRDFVKEFVSHLPLAKQMTYQEWRDRVQAPDSRKLQYDVAYNKLRGGRPSKKQASSIQAFGKTESYPEYKHVRLINSRSDAFKVFSGPLFKAIEDIVYELPYFIKHVPVPDRPALIAALRGTGIYYYSTDFKAFESHFTRELMNACECELYRHCLSWHKDVEFLCRSLTGLNRLHTRTGIKASLTARRMSGDMCTSLGNGFTNLMLALFIAHSKKGTIQGYVEGDDGIFSTSEPMLAEDYQSLGFTIKIERIDDPCTASFCGLIFSESGQIIRDPRRFFQNFGWTHSFIGAGPKIMLELLLAKALSALYETPHCPIVSHIAYYAFQKTKHLNPRFIQDGYHNQIPEFLVRPPQPSATTRLLMQREFNIDVCTQIVLESDALRGDFSRISTLIPPNSHVSSFANNYLLVE